MKPPRSIIARVRAADPRRMDLVVALALTGLGVVEVLTAKQPHHALTAVAIALLSLPLAWRRRAPLAITCSAVSVMVIQQIAGGHVYDGPNAPFLATLLIAYSLGLHATPRRAFGGLAVLCVGVDATQLLGGSDVSSVGDLLWAGALYGPPWLAGRALRSRLALQRELRAKARRLERDRDEHARASVERERALIAEELHEIVASGVTAMVIYAKAIDRLIEGGEIHRARGAFGAVEEQGREALTEMRRLLGVLRRDGERGALAPQPTLGRIDALVAAARAHGRSVHVETLGTPEPLPPGLDLAAYRLVEHAVGRADAAEVVIDYGDRDLELTVTAIDPAPENGSAAELTAIRERMELYGGHLRVDRGDGGVVIRARVPREEMVPA